jgi:uncharacterized damage-inducible protein DinB
VTRLDHFRRLFEHQAWADRRVLTVAATLGTRAEGRVLRLLAHLLAAERVWLARVRGDADSATLPIWPELSTRECAELATRNAAGYDAFLGGIDDAALDGEVAYANSKGTPFRTTLGDILTQVALHGSYHRGQIASAVRALEEEPVNTDFITFAREEARG